MAQQGMDQAAAGGGEDVSADEIVQNVSDTIMSLAQAAGQQRPDVAQKLQKIGQEFMDIMSEFVGGGAQQQQQRGGAQPVAERGQGMPMGPQGAM
jgi:hypothetical protein